MQQKLPKLRSLLNMDVLDSGISLCIIRPRQICENPTLVWKDFRLAKLKFWVSWARLIKYFFRRPREGLINAQKPFWSIFTTFFGHKTLKKTFFNAKLLGFSVLLAREHIMEYLNAKKFEHCYYFLWMRGSNVPS